MTAAAKKWTHDLNWLKPLVAVVIIIAAVVLLVHALSRYNPDEILAAIGRISPYRLMLGGLCAAGSYVCLTWFDWLGLRYLGKPLPYRKAALASFVSLSIGHNIGFAGLSSGALRYRFYTHWGLTLAQVAKLVVFSGVTVALGLITLGGIAILARPQLAADIIGLDRAGVLALGLGCLAVDALYLFAAAFARKPIRLWRWSLEVPPLHMALAQIALGAVNYAFVAGCLYNTMADISQEPYLSVAAVYVLANTAALIAHIPGGVGVIEGVVALLLPDQPTIAAVLMFRALYYLLPLAIGGLLFAATELYWRKHGKPRARG
jgi:uncharacterized membrane protein YbhN (UPF0104 family)